MLEFPPRQRSSGVEQLIRNQQVVSSNLTVGSIFLVSFSRSRSRIDQENVAPFQAAFVSGSVDRLRRLVKDIPDVVLVGAADLAELVARGFGLGIGNSFRSTPG